MRTKGVGPRNLGVSPLKAKSDPPVPGKALVQGYRDYAANKNNTRYDPDAFANREILPVHSFVPKVNIVAQNR